MPGLSCSMQTLSCSIRDLVPWPGIEPRPPVSGAWNLSHWTTGEVPPLGFTTLLYESCSFLGGSNGKQSAGQAGYSGLIPGSRRSPGEGNGNLLQSSCLENPMDGSLFLFHIQGSHCIWFMFSSFSIFFFFLMFFSWDFTRCSRKAFVYTYKNNMHNIYIWKHEFLLKKFITKKFLFYLFDLAYSTEY